MKTFTIWDQDIIDQVNKEWEERGEEFRIQYGQEFFLDRYRELWAEKCNAEADEEAPDNADLTGW